MFPALAQLCPESLLYNNHHLSGSQAAGESGEARMPGSALIQVHQDEYSVGTAQRSDDAMGVGVAVRGLVRGSGQSDCSLENPTLRILTGSVLGQ